MKAILIKLTHYIKMAVPLIIVVAVLGCLAGWAWHQYAPHPLGSQMEYLGKEDYGNILGFDSAPASTYYYGTDMEPGEMKNYFTAQYSPQKNLAYKNAYFTAGTKDFMFTYEFHSSFSTRKKYIVSISNSQYETAKNYLKK